MKVTATAIHACKIPITTMSAASTGAALDLLRFAGRTLRLKRTQFQITHWCWSKKIKLSQAEISMLSLCFCGRPNRASRFGDDAIAQRRVALMVDPTLSFDLPPFLTPEPGINRD